ncbi:MAG: DUF29 domain-containing protein [Beijerinckiaceae bacterium]
MAANLYETDFYSWTRQQANLIRSGKVELADLPNIAEEIETLGRSERAALESAYRLISMHLLKLMFQPEKMSRSWLPTILRERLNAARLLKNNPGLKPSRTELFLSAYEDARKEAAVETGLALGTFPPKPPFELDQAESETFLPTKPAKERPAKGGGD